MKDVPVWDACTGMRGRPVSEADAGKAISIIAHVEEEPCRACR